MVRFAKSASSHAEYFVRETPVSLTQAALRNLRAEGMDLEALRFQAFCADHLVRGLTPFAGHRVLDLQAGSGGRCADAGPLGPGDSRGRFPGNAQAPRDQAHPSWINQCRCACHGSGAPGFQA